MKFSLVHLKNFVEYKIRYYLEDIELKKLAQIYKNDYGYLSTIIDKKPIDHKLESIPWFTYPAIEFLGSLNLKSSHIYEWGSGNSSTYFATRCLTIESVESDEKWYKYQLDNLKTNQKICLIDANSKEYATSILSSDFPLYDIIIVDGRQRRNCLMSAISKIKNNGILILDNSDWYPMLCLSLRRLKFIQIDFHGFGPINKYTWTTSIFIACGDPSNSSDVLYNRVNNYYYSKSCEKLVSEDDAMI